jgi:TusA-related sulfurtransferase
MTEERMAAMRKGEVLEVLFTDRGARPDLEAWCRATGNQILEFKEEKWRTFGYIRKA